MSNNNTNDPYAGQYPPPPPLPAEDLAVHEQLYRRQTNPEYSEPFYLIDQSHHRHDYPSGSHTVTSSSHSMPEIRGHYYEESDYQDPEAIDLRDYLYAERQEKLRKQQVSSVSRPEVYSDNVYYENTSLSPTSMISPVLFNHQPSFVSPPIFKQGSHPSTMPPVLLPPPPPPPPPMMMVNTEKYRQRHCSCCCGVSCFACIWTLLLIVIFLVGIALVVLSIVMANKCNGEFATQNGTLCRQEFHDGTLYGGIVIAGLAALIIVWRLLRWLCTNPP